VKNKRKMYEALIEGKKLLHLGRRETITMNDEGAVVDGFGCGRIVENMDPEDWEIYEEPEVYEVECEWEPYGGYALPLNVGKCFHWAKLVGKRTKLRIEVIK
jgi:hypothetical protein